MRPLELEVRTGSARNGAGSAEDAVAALDRLLPRDAGGTATARPATGAGAVKLAQTDP